VRALRKAKRIERAAKDLLRASNLPLLPRDEPHVGDELKKIHNAVRYPIVRLTATISAPS
jgi:hypothetical protein